MDENPESEARASGVSEAGRRRFTWFVRFVGKDCGATATEYAILVGLIAIVIVAGVTFFGQNLGSWFDRLGTQVQSLIH